MALIREIRNRIRNKIRTNYVSGNLMAHTGWLGCANNIRNKKLEIKITESKSYIFQSSRIHKSDTGELGSRLALRKN